MKKPFDLNSTKVNILAKLEEFGRNHDELNKAIGLKFDSQPYCAIVWNFNRSENADFC